MNEYKDTDALANKAIGELSCQSYFLDYQACVAKPKKNYSECVDKLETFRYCMVYREEAKIKKGPEKSASPIFGK